MQRRGFLKAIAATVACPVCAGLASGVAQAAEKAGGGHGGHWSYEGEGGPEHWGELEDGFKACSIGREQSPIDLHEPIPAMVGGLKINWKTIPLTVLNNGHTIQVDAQGGGTLEVNGRTYDLLQFHFHHPSEHTVNGAPHAMEVHFVHKSAAGDLAVVGVFLRPGAENPVITPIWAAMPTKGGDKVSKPEVNITPAGLLPARDVTFRYAGSLTTPPCSEIVSWIVYQDPVELSASQVAAFATLFPMNARPVQGLNRRNLLIGAF